MRVPLIAANWKMNKTVSDTVSFVGAFIPEIRPLLDAWGETRGEGPALPGGALEEARVPWPEILICPPFTSLPALSSLVASYPIRTGAQDVFWETKGAFTGEISPTMLKDLGCRYVIVGHSERRHIMGETGEMVAKKVRAALDAGLRPILCVGETLAEREKGEALKVNSEMTSAGLAKVNKEEISQVVVAYEPVWAIGTGKEARPEDAAEVIREIRGAIDSLFGRGASEDVRVLYGGSVKAANIRSFMNREEIDGALVGGASLDPHEFARLVFEVSKARPEKLGG
ncbi:MAG TPA: triose-phosphate isomerase [Firmicutes bacterium]|nr:triose-phosphate isomerase [Candidatus Fermentithermobacillaceae bacterium]